MLFDEPDGGVITAQEIIESSLEMLLHSHCFRESWAEEIFAKDVSLHYSIEQKMTQQTAHGHRAVT